MLLLSVAVSIFTICFYRGVCLPFHVAFNRLVQVHIKAKSFFGARHALSTLQQLIWYDDEDNLWRILDNVHITDEPKFRYFYLDFHLIKQRLMQIDIFLLCINSTFS